MSATSKQASALEQAVDMLTRDHDAVSDMFREYKKLMDYDAPASERKDLAQRICNALSIHAELEEKVFYPAAREALPEDAEECLDHAEVEHASIKRLVSEIEAGNAEDALFDAKVHVLGEYVAHHVEEEECEMFAELRKEEAAMKGVPAAMAKHRAQWAEHVDAPYNAKTPRAKYSSASGSFEGDAKAAVPNRQRVSASVARKQVLSQGSNKAQSRKKDTAAS